MSRPISLTLRLTLLFTVVATIGFLTFGWVIGNSLEDHFDAEDIKELNVVAQAVQDSLSTQNPNDSLTHIEQRFDDILIGHHGALLLIVDAAGNQLYANPGPDLSTIHKQLTPGKVKQLSDGTYNFRALVHKVNISTEPYKSPLTIVVAVTTDSHLHFLEEFRHTLWIMVFTGIVVMGVMGWIVVRHGHHPLHRIVDQVSRVNANELSTRIDPNSVPVEISELAVSFNDLLQRLEESFNRLSNFSADIAHELRTPITNLMTQTQVAISQARSVKEYQEILYSNMEEYERLAQMIGDMLFLAKADNALAPPNNEEVNLEGEIRNLFDYYEAFAEEQQISLKLEGSSSVKGDRLMLRRALNNLLSNAIRHTAPNNTVTVQLNSGENKTSISIQNPGTPLTPEHLNKIFDRFYRVDPSRQRSSEGAGLGLAIVKSIIEAHGGEITATSDEASTQFIIYLPTTF